MGKGQKVTGSLALATTVCSHWVILGLVTMIFPGEHIDSFHAFESNNNSH